jgi:hypothetical protein
MFLQESHHAVCSVSHVPAEKNAGEPPARTSHQFTASSLTRVSACVLPAPCSAFRRIHTSASITSSFGCRLSFPGLYAPRIDVQICVVGGRILQFFRRNRGSYPVAPGFPSEDRASRLSWPRTRPTSGNRAAAYPLHAQVTLTTCDKPPWRLSVRRKCYAILTFLLGPDDRLHNRLESTAGWMSRLPK